jgi:plastocyanin
MQRVVAGVVAFVIAGGMVACAGSSSAGAQTRKVLVDYNNDAFAVSSFGYYPKQLTIRPGDTVEFEQKWTGEPHSVTMGRLVDENMEGIIDVIDRVLDLGEIPEEYQEEEPEEFEVFGQALPFAFGEEGLAQNAAQPCYVTEDSFTGAYPGDDQTPCENRTQPAFSNDYVIYNSGLIPFEGVGGNTFKVDLADDLEPGAYAFYCNVHGPLQYGQLEVVEKGSDIPSAGEVARQAREEAERDIDPMGKAYREALRGGKLAAGETGEVEVDVGGLNIAGVPTPFFTGGRFVHGIVNEYVPNEVQGKVGEKVTWTFMGHHTISFNVPEYFPIFTVAADGTTSMNPQAEPAIGGWPDRPEPEGGGEPPPGEEGEGPPGGGGEPVHIDVGEWDGKGFKSTGLSYSDGDTLTVAFTQPGTYTYACLIHPEMIAKVIIKP